jgi:alpha-tubulin suppressor-like RCC1 family protein
MYQPNVVRGKGETLHPHVSEVPEHISVQGKRYIPAITIRGLFSVRFVWGGNRYAQAKVPNNLVDVKSISAGCHYSMAMMNDGTVFGWGRNENNQVSIPKGITNAFSIGAGYVNSVISLRDGRVIVIGAPEHGVLITRTPTKTATPTP